MACKYIYKGVTYESKEDFVNKVINSKILKKADVILPIGTSGSGKSTFIKSLPQENLVVIEPDSMRVEFTGDMNDKSKDKEIYIEAAKRAVKAIKEGKQVVFDTTNLTKDKRLPFIEAIKKEIPNANIQYKLMELNPELAKQRIKAQLARGENRANVSDATIDRHAESYKQMLLDISSEDITPYIEQSVSPTKTRRILEMQSDLFQKGRDNKDLITQTNVSSSTNQGFVGTANQEEYLDAMLYSLTEYEGYSQREAEEKVQKERERLISLVPSKKDTSENQFLQLLNKDNNWVTFFVKSIIQDSAKKGYEKVLFPKGDTASKIEGHSTLEEFKRQKEDRIKELEEENKVLKDNELENQVKSDNLYEIKRLNEELERVEREGFAALRPIYDFYENTVANILKKQGYNSVKITDEFGNTWYEISINQARDLDDILLQRNEANKIIGQANIKAMTVLVDAVNKKADTIPHEYAHHYIAWFRNTPIVQEGIKRFGSEEALVQAIGEQVVKQKGEAYNWWKKFTNWILNLLSDKQLLQILTDSFLNRQDLNDFTYNQLTLQQAQQLYSKYLDTIFPDSQMKNIVYRGGNLGTKQPQDVEAFTTNKSYAEYRAEQNNTNVYPAILNIKNSELVEKKETRTLSLDRDEFQYKDYGFTDNKDQTKQLGNFYTVKENNRHILGSKQDINGFKEFIGKEDIQYQKGYINKKLRVSEFAIRDVAARLVARIGGKVKFENNKNVNYQGYREGDTYVINLAKATLDTPIHEIMGHPIISAIKNKNQKQDDGFQELEFTLNNIKYKRDGLADFYTKNDREINETEYNQAYKEFKNNILLNNSLYQNLLKELETGYGKKVLDRVKKEYRVKYIPKTGLAIGRPLLDKAIEQAKKEGKTEIKLGDKFNIDGKNYEYRYYEGGYANFLHEIVPFTLEEQQEEALVQLLGELTANKELAKKKMGNKLYSYLKQLLREMTAYMRSLFNSKEIEIDKLSADMTLNDLANLLAYTNSKIILPGGRVEYTIGDGVIFNTYAEMSNHISELVRQAEKYVDLDLSKVEIDKEDVVLKRFLEANKEYAQAREIIEIWKKDNNIVYRPEEAWSRGQEFIHVHNAYGNVDTITWLQNLPNALEAVKKANGVMELSFLTYMQGKVPTHVIGNINEKAIIKIIAYPKPSDIAFASKIDNYTSSYSKKLEGLQYFIDLSKVKKREQLAVNYTKSIKLSNINTIEPNIADTIDDVAHHNEYAINIADGNFRIEYGEETPYEIKKLVDSVNSILDSRYGKIIKPEITTKETGDIVYRVGAYFSATHIAEFNTKEEAQSFINSYKQENANMPFKEDLAITPSGVLKGIQPTQTKENTTSIESVKNKIVKDYSNFKDLSTGNTLIFKEDGFDNNKIGDKIIYDNNEYEIVGEVKENSEFPAQWQLKVIEKEYTEQALINTKIARLKEVAKKYPRSLITSKVINNQVSEKQYQRDMTDVFKQSKIESEEFKNYVNSQKKDIFAEDWTSETNECGI